MPSLSRPLSICLIILTIVLLLAITGRENLRSSEAFSAFVSEYSEWLDMLSYQRENRQCIKTINGNEGSVDTSYRFFIAGHVYGDPYDTASTGLYPKFLRALKAKKNSFDFGIFAGDVARVPSPENWGVLKSQLARLGLEQYYVAPGNHDIAVPMDEKSSRSFSENFNELDLSFVFKNDLFILLNPYVSGWSIKGEQKRLLKQAIESKASVNGVDNIFVIFHPVIFHGEGFEAEVNSFDGRKLPVNFWSEIFPFTEQIKKKIFFVAGDLGSTGKKAFFCRNYSNSHFLGTGMGSGISDNFLIFEKKGTKMKLTPIFF